MSNNTSSNTEYSKLINKLVTLVSEERPSPAALAQIGAALYEQGYIEGKEMQRKLLRLQLGLSVPEDRT